MSNPGSPQEATSPLGPAPPLRMSTMDQPPTSPLAPQPMPQQTTQQPQKKTFSLSEVMGGASATATPGATPTPQPGQKLSLSQVMGGSGGATPASKTQKPQMPSPKASTSKDKPLSLFETAGEIESLTGQSRKVPGSKLTYAEQEEAGNAAFLRGFPLGTYYDEVQSAFEGMGSLLTGKGFASGYQADQERHKKVMEIYDSEHPIASTLRTVAGAAASIPVTEVKALQLAKGLPWYGRSAVGALTNGVFGAAQGFGEGTTTDERMNNAIMGGGFGTVAGLIFPPLGRLFSSPAGRTAAGGAIGAGIGAYENPTGNEYASTLGGATAGALAATGSNVALSRFGSPMEFASSYLARALQSDKISLKEAKNLLGEEGRTISDLGPKGSPSIRAAGEQAALKGEGNRLAENLYHGRQDTREERLAQKVNTMISDQSFYGTTDSLAKGRRISARPLYTEAFKKADSQGPFLNQRSTAFEEFGKTANEAQTAVDDAERELTMMKAKHNFAGDNVYANSSANQDIKAAETKLEQAKAVRDDAHARKDSLHGDLRQSQADIAEGKRTGFTTPHLEYIMQDPIAQRGLRRGLGIQAREARADNVPFDPHEWGIVGFDSSGNPIPGKTLSLRSYDAAKRGIDAELDRLRDTTTGKLPGGEYVGSILDLRKALVKQLDLYAPEEYALARKAWEGPSRLIEAIGEGRDFATKDPEEILKFLADKSPTERDAYKIGVARWAADQLGQTTRGPLTLAQKFTTSNMRKRLEAAIGDKERVDQLIAASQREIEDESRGQQFTRNSRTATRQEASKEFGDVHPVIDAGISGGRHTFSGLATGAHQHFGRLGSHWLADQMQAMSDARREALGKLLFSTNREDNIKALEMIYDEAKAKPKSPLVDVDPTLSVVSGVTGMTGTSAPGAAQQPPPQQQPQMTFDPNTGFSAGSLQP